MARLVDQRPVEIEDDSPVACFSRLKGQRSLNSIKVRGFRKVTVHVYLSLIAMQSVAL